MKYVICIMVLFTLITSTGADGMRIFAMYNRTDAQAIATCDKLHRRLQIVYAGFPEYFDMSNTNVLSQPLNGKQATECWSDLHKWTNVAGTVSVHWMHALPNETNGIPLKKLVLTTVTKDQIKNYMASNSCVITNIPSDYKVITNSAVIYRFGQ